MGNTKIHKYGLEILRKLIPTNGQKFNQLSINGLETVHMNYHLKKLISLGLVIKAGNQYTLSDIGKEYIGMLDNDKREIEKQPKVSILLNIRRKNSKGEIEHLLSKRLIQPYIGKIGRLTGKVQYGEGIYECALRELFEETGLESNLENIKLVQIYQKIRSNEENEVVQDGIFFITNIYPTGGVFISKTDVQENFWITKKELEGRKDLDLFDSFVLHDEDEIRPHWYSMSKAQAIGY